MSPKKRRTPPVDPLLPFIGQLERLKVLGILVDYGTGPGPDELWVGVSEATAAKLGAYGRALRDPDWWRQTTRSLGLAHLQVAVRTLGADEVPAREPEARLRMPQGSFEDVAVGDVVCRMLAGRIPMLLTVTSVDGELIHAGAPGAGWTFDRETGVEVDDELGWGPDYGISGSYLVHEEEA